MADKISLLPATAAWLSTLGLGDFFEVETPERMAAVALLMRELSEDFPESFPHGKWGTLQAIELQLQEWAKRWAEPLNAAARMR